MKNILIVDDRDEDRLLCRVILEAKDYNVTEADSAEEALKLLRGNKFDVVITDIMMPGMDGIELTKIVHKKYKDTEVIGLSIYNNKFTAMDAIKHGASSYVIKPFTKEELSIAVKSALRTKTLKVEAGHLEGIVALHKASKAMISENPPDKILAYILEITVNTIRADGGSIMLIDRETGEYIVRAAAGTYSKDVIGKSFKPGQRVSGRAILEKKPVLVNNGVRKTKWFKQMKKYEDIISGMSVPIIIRDEVLGTINLKRTNTEGEFNSRDVEIVDILAANAALTIENANLAGRK
ncbi:MAG: response regulator [Elusimicrobia bacterium]|jgi:CheY-like chemotaxis protein|nr:response regulator [Elusimicrobiota bacterium]